MSTSELSAGGARAPWAPGARRPGAAVKAALYVAMAILAVAGIYGALSGASAGMTLLAGIGVGVLWTVASRGRNDGR